MPGEHTHGKQRSRLSRAFHAIPPWAQQGLRFTTLATIMCAGVFTAWALLVSVPSVETIENRAVSESTKIYDRTGNVLLYDVHGSMRRTEVPFDQISPFIRNATVSIEDATFYQHNGFRPLAFLRAVLVNLGLRSGYRGQGGSTITQQVIKNTLLTKDKTPIRKAKEIVLALKLERITTKDEILNLYLNETSYGGTIYGVEEASRYFFGKSAIDVTLAEAAYLASLPQAPTRYSPYGNHRDELNGRKDLVLTRMYDLGHISEEDYQLATAEEVVFREQAEAGIKAPHFVFYVRELLEQKYGADAIANEGLQVITTLDYDLQQKAEEIVKERALANEQNFNAENAGLVAIEPNTGQVLAMVGSRDYFDEDIDGKVNVTLAHRQPGSSFKPFVYAKAFEQGYTPETVVFDLRTQFTSHCEPQDLTTHDECYAPVNYDDLFRGPMTLRNALAQSINVPAVKVLYLVGVTNAIDMAERLGITSLTDAGRYGLTLVLGGGEVQLLEMVAAYGVFAAEGERHPTTPLLEVRDSDDDTIEQYEDTSERVLDMEIARQVSDVLSDNEARSPTFGGSSALHFPGVDVAVKTGTTNDYRDAWIIGYTPRIAVGSWAGNNDNSEMIRRVAGLIVAPMWREFMDYALVKYPPEDFTPPSPDPEWDSLPPVLRGEWNTNPSMGTHDILFWVNKQNPRSGTPPQNPQSDSQFNHWEYPVSVWAGQQTYGSTTPQNGFSVASPLNGSTIPWGLSFQTWVSFDSSLGITQVSYYLNNVFVGVSAQPPYLIEVQPSARGPATIRAVAETPTGNIESSTGFTIQ